MSELKFIFTGPPGAGKTTAITAISDCPPVTTDMNATDELLEVKDKTTVAMDFGQLTLADGETVFLYGTPGQERFRYMWEILIRGGLGLVVLIDNTRSDPVSDMRMYLENFREFINSTGAVIAINRSELRGSPTISDFQDALSEMGMILPIMYADPRSKEDVLVLLEMLMSVAELSDVVEEEDNGFVDALRSL
jgi:signal recognition particle receptor subunit beta